jgi:hypothetical protein
MPKVYFKDLGMRNVALNRFFDLKNRDDQGALVENYTYKRLSSIYDSDNLKYWRTADKKEIDFVINTSFSSGFAYEVKVKCSSGKSTSVKTFKKEYPNYPLEIVSYDYNPECKWILKL